MSRIKKISKKIIHSTLAKIGAIPNIQSQPPLIDLRYQCSHPNEIHYLTQFPPVLMNVELQLGRGLRIFKLNHQHPYVRILKSAVNAPHPLDTIKHLLHKYYELVRPSSAAEWLGITDPNSRLHNVVPWGLSMPWDLRTPEQWREARENFVLHENGHFGEHLTINDGWHFWGPVSDSKLNIETQRLENILSSVKQKGLDRHDGHDGDIRAVILKWGNEWRWQVAGGEHRAAAFAALGFNEVPVRVIQIVQLEDIDLWPGVKNGSYSKETAREVFINIFNGKTPALTAEWNDNQRIEA